MNKETINELERLNKEQLDKVLDYAYLLDEHIYFKRESRKLKQALIDIKNELTKHQYDLDYEPWSVYKIGGEILFNILQIIDKVLDSDKVRGE